MEWWKKRWQRPTFFRFSLLMCILDSEIVKDDEGKTLAGRFWLWHMGNSSVILHFSSLEKVRSQNLWKETYTFSIWWFSCTLKSVDWREQPLKFWFWKGSQEPLIGSFLDVKRYLSEPKSAIGSWHFCDSCRVSELLAVQNIWMCKRSLYTRRPCLRK